MVSSRACLVLFVAAALVAAPAFAVRSRHTASPSRATSARKLSSSHKASAKSSGRKTAKLAGKRAVKAAAKSPRLHGQQAIATDRVTQIQQALIREHYFSGEANGQWDSTTIAAMQKYQSDQGWQTKLTPDSRALKKLGLGPDYSGAINARDSSFAAPPPSSTIPAEQAAGFAASSGVN